MQVEGTNVEQGSNIHLEYTTVTFKTKNDKIDSGFITNTQGRFKIDVPIGVYNISIEYISYKTINYMTSSWY